MTDLSMQFINDVWAEFNKWVQKDYQNRQFSQLRFYNDQSGMVVINDSVVVEGKHVMYFMSFPDLLVRLKALNNDEQTE